MALNEIVGNAVLQSGMNSANVSIYGINRGYFDSNDSRLLCGRYLSESNTDNNTEHRKKGPHFIIGNPHNAKFNTLTN